VIIEWMKPCMLIVQDIDFLCHADYTEKTESEEHEQNKNDINIGPLIRGTDDIERKKCVTNTIVQIKGRRTSFCCELFEAT